MRSTRTPAFAAAAFLAFFAAACADSRPASLGGSSSGTDTCVFCHGSVGRVGNLPNTDLLLPSAPPAAPAGKPAAVVGAHQVHLNPPINGPLRGPIACNECHVVPTSLSHATNPPANPVAFGTLARARGAAPTYEAVTLGCSTVYCHGNFDFNGVQGKAASVTWNGGVVGCGDCHALPPTGHQPLGVNVTRATCSQCHPNTVNPDGTINVNGGGHINGLADVAYSCTSCHGTAGRLGIQPGTDPTLASAPPVAPAGAPSYAVGAHQPHLNPPAAGSMRGPLPCAECHIVPATPDHATNPPAVKVVFGTLARTQNASPTWTSTSTGCAATYCHGNFAFNGVIGSNATPLWTGAAVTCVSCHGMPPSGHPALTGTVTAATCSQCHPGTVNANGSINIAGGAHLNGQSDVVLDCTSCHGTAGRTGILPGTDPLLASAPPVAPVGAPAHAVGAHQNHLNPPATGAFRGPIVCAECHVVPANSAHATNPPAATVVFGTLARTGGANPTWTSTSTGCAATYCHGNFTFNLVRGANAAPLWTATGLSCTSCHGMPPDGHPGLAGTVTAATCNQCHPSAVNATGTINLAAGAHLNGVPDVNFNCTSCHGTAGRTGNLVGTDPQLAASPPVATAGAPASAVGAHQFHVNPPSTGAFRGPIFCNECHVLPTDTAHANNPPASPVVFGTLAKTQGASPTWNPVTTGCSATYCHGNFVFFGSIRGASGTPLWTDTTITCVNCHALPPTGHPALAGTVTPATCSQCHPSTVNANGTINVATGAHINGLPDVAAGCTDCHGTAGRTVPAGNPNALLPSAPPVAPPGSPASVVGTHLLHLIDSTIRAAITCNECHVVPGNPDHAIQFPTVIVFSPNTLATTQSAAPTYDPINLSCSATYCHGNFTFGTVRGNTTPTAAWNASPTLSCTGCHGLPPTNHPALTGTVTAATCSQCHPDTVNANGTINVTGGKHMNGQSNVSGNPHTGDPIWAQPSRHGYSASAQGLQNCTGCHLGFESPAGTTGGSCNTCHGGVAWQTNCTFCHGAPARASTSLNPQLAAAPPVDSQGNSASNTARVGAHAKHLLTPTLSIPFACGNCHSSTLPANVSHVDGALTLPPFGLIALTGNVTPTFNPATLSCSATYCHGNFPGGATSAAPLWTGAAMTCTSCHGNPPATGRHPLDKHASFIASCGTCHSLYTATAANTALHVNGVKNVGGSGTSINSWNAGTKSCGPACHGTKTW